MDVVCSKCKKTVSIRGRLERDQIKNFVCNECARKGIFLELINYIKTRIAVTRTDYENQGRMVLRELVQNADDAKATMLVLRFETKALYVANDGKAFTTRSVGTRTNDFDRLSEILGRHKAEESDSTGHFGSGFQTVYVFTNHPEVHSGGRSGRIDPVQSQWIFFKPDDHQSLVSPYEGRKEEESKGALFVFPWRDDEAAAERFDGDRTPFLDDAFPRWPLKAREDLFQDLKTYLRHVLLCCQHLKLIRLVWDDANRKEAFQGVRNFSLAEPTPRLQVGQVEQGGVAASAAWFDWDPRGTPEDNGSDASFQTTIPGWESDRRKLEYMVCSDHVRDDSGHELRVGKAANDKDWIITNDPKKLPPTHEREPNDIHLLLPFFNIEEVDPTDPRAFLYSVIPLPSRSKNLFVFSGHFFPDESRTDVSVSSQRKVDGEWHRHIVLSVGRLYLSAIEGFLDKARRLEAPTTIRQQIMLNAIPGCHLSEWMRPGKEPSGEWAESLNREISERLATLRIIYTERGWRAPSESLWTTKPDGDLDNLGLAVVDWLGQGVFTPAFVNHRNFVATLRTPLRERIMDAGRFCQLFARALEENGGQLSLNQSLKSGSVVSKHAVDDLVAYCIMAKTASTELTRLPIVPGADGLLRPLESYGIIPPELKVLGEILPGSHQIHPDFSESLANIGRSSRLLDPDRALGIVNQIVRDNTERYDPLSQDDLVRFSRLLVALVSHPDFRLKQPHFGFRFIPITYDRQNWLTSPNATTTEAGDSEVFLDSRPEHYRREFVYAETAEPVPGVTPELKDKIRFLRLEGVASNEGGLVPSKLYLVALQGGGTPTNFVRQFLSDRQPSLFRDEVMSEFLGIDTPSDLILQKERFLDAFRRYFRPNKPASEDDPTGGARASEDDLRPNDVGRIPCLYDENGIWRPAGSFCLSLQPELEVFKYHTLHPDFVTGTDRWPEETLLAMGVASQPSPERVVEVVRELAKNPERNRRILADIFVYIVTAPHSWKTSLDGLRSFPWVPVAGGGSGSLDGVLLPTDRVQSIVGPKHEALFDGEACHPTFVKYLKGEGAKSDPSRLAELHIIPEPNVQMLMELTAELASSKASPPPRLFDTLRELLKDAQPAPLSGTGWFYFSERWWSTKRIFRETDPSVGTSFGPDLLFLDPGTFERFRGFLLYAGARESVDSRMILERMQALSDPKLAGDVGSREALQSLWAILERRARDGEFNARGVSVSDISYPFPDGLVSVGKIIVSSDRSTADEFFPDGHYGNWYVVSTPTLRYPKSLLALGAKNRSALEDGELVSLLESIGLLDEPLPRDLLEVQVSLITRLAEGTERADLGDRPIWPVRHGELYSLSNLAGVYLGDHPLYREFEDDVPLLYEPEGTQLRNRFFSRALAQSTSCQSLASSVQIVDRSVGTRKADDESTERVRMIARVLRVRYPESSAAPKGSFEWMEDTTVSRVDELSLVVQLGTMRKTIEDSCQLRVESGKVEIDILPAHRALPDELTRKMANETSRRGLRFEDSVQRGKSGRTAQPPEGVSRPDFESVVYRLLTRPAEDWDLFIVGLPPIERGPRPLTSDEVEVAPGYLAVLQTLRRLYGYCQICGRKTPEAEGSPETRERVRSLVSERGGLYYGPLERYDLKNSLFLCPLHYTLFERSLVKFPDLHVAADLRATTANKLRSLGRAWGDKSQLLVKVYEAINKDETLEWRDQPLELKKEHARSMLPWMADWLEGGGPDGRTG